ncbi:hypothetical protein RQP46_005820 [Phenoliferia psychrophenolica]
MARASSSTPAQDKSTAPLAPTSLLSLPNELLVKIARVVAPDGGRKAGNLRLVCRHLGDVVAPVTWASIVLPTDADGLDELGDELLHNRTGHTSLVNSVRYNKPAFQPRGIVQALKALPSLRRLHLAGTSEGQEGLFVPKHGLLKGLKRIQNLQLDYVDLDNLFDIASWAPSVSTLSHFRCANAHLPFRDSANQIQGNLEFEVRTKPFLFKLTGATKLFKHSPPNDPAAPLIVQILNWVARGPLTTLALPVFGTFFANDALSNLSLPRVQTLVLDADSISNYTQLARFLTLASLPILSTLHLRGWFEGTGASKLAQIVTEDLPAEAPLIYLLLGVLRKTAVVELRLENSVDHAESDVQCIFSRDGSGEWESRLARFW